MAEWEPAIDLAKKALATRKKRLGADDPDLADSLAVTAFITTGAIS